jgi:fluoroacetyl-CoA thioesterase
MLEPGLSIEQRRTILEADCVKFLGRDVQPSLSTPAMIQWMEVASRDLVKPRLEPGQDTVGVRVDVEHLAATPLGAQVVFRSKLTHVDGRQASFEVEALDGDEVVGRGRHTRFIIDVERFARGLKKRFEARGDG